MDWIIAIGVGLLVLAVIYHLVILAWIVLDFLYEEIKFRLKQLKIK